MLTHMVTVVVTQTVNVDGNNRLARRVWPFWGLTTCDGNGVNDNGNGC